MKHLQMIRDETNYLDGPRRSMETCFFLFGLCGYWHCGHSWPIVPASGDNEDDYGEADVM
jgi:hypothetical protein